MSNPLFKQLPRVFAAAQPGLQRVTQMPRGAVLSVGVLMAAGVLMLAAPPVQSVGRGEAGLRINTLTGQVDQFSEGKVLVVPVVHTLRVLPLREQSYRPFAASLSAHKSVSAEQAGVGQTEGEPTLNKPSHATAAMPLQSAEGLSFGADLVIRWSVAPDQLRRAARELPDDIPRQVLQPAIQGVYGVFSRYTVREIYASKRAEIEQALVAELRPRLAAEGLTLAGVQIGQVQLPEDYRRGMDKLLAEELEAEKMRFTLALKQRKVQESEFEAEADKVRREKTAEAAAREQVIAARAQEEAMKHVLPFKHKQIEQRQLEAEAEKAARIKNAEAQAASRRIEAQAEADSRQKLADAEAYRLDKVGKANSEQMAREGALISKHPLLVQKTLADKLSDKVQVIIAPPPADGGFIGAGLVGALRQPVAEQAQAGADESSQ